MIKFKKGSLDFWPLLVFSIPSIFSSLLEPMSSMVDTALVGHQNSLWLAALSVASTIFNSISWVFNFIVHVLIQKMGEALGENDKDKAVRSFKLALIVSFTIGALCILSLSIFKESVFFIGGAREEFNDILSDYFYIRLWGHPLSLLLLASIAALRAYKRVALSFWLLLSTTILNGILSFSFIYIWDWGIEGVAWGTVISYCFSLSLSLFLLFTKDIKPSDFMKANISMTDIKSLGSSSFFMQLRSLFLTATFIASNKIASLIGTNTLATHQIILQCWLLSAYIMDGLAISANILGSRLVSHKNWEDFKKMTFNLLLWGFILGSVFTGVYWALGTEIISVFTNDREIIDHALIFWGLIAFSQPLNALCFVEDGILFSTNDFNFLQRNMIIGVLFCFCPLAYLAVIDHNYKYILIGFIFLNFYRFLSSSVRINGYLKR